MAHKANELRNFVELKIKKENYIRWKFALNRLFNNKIEIIDDSEYKKNLLEILEYLMTLKNIYPLFNNDLVQINKRLSENNILELIDLENFVKQTLMIFNTSKDTANLSKFNLKDKIGRLPDKNLTQGTIIYKSITGIREKKYEF